MNNFKNLLFLTLLIFSCEKSDNSNRINFDILKCKAERNAFLKLQPYSYSYVFSDCYNSPLFKLFIKDGEIDSISNYPAYNHIDTQYVAKHKIDSLFGEIIHTYESNQGVEKNEEDYYVTGISCNYDSLYHFPVNWEYTYHQGLGDAVLFGCFRIDSFTVLSK